MQTSPTIRDRISAVMRVQEYFPPAAPEDVVDVGRQLGVPFPDWLREIYAAADGFVGPTGVRYLYRLKTREGVLGMNLTLRDDWYEATWLKRAIVFAENGIGGSLTVHWAALDGQLIEWCYGDGIDCQVLDVDIFGAWAREQRRWDELDAAP